MGAKGVGKSSLIHRYINGSFKENSLPETENPLYIIKPDITISNNAIRLAIMDCYDAKA